MELETVSFRLSGSGAVFSPRSTARPLSFFPPSLTQPLPPSSPLLHQDGNEKECGDGVARAIKDGLVKREELFITSKLWNTFHAKEHVPQLVKKQLADWQLEYFDLFLIHFPVSIA